MIFVYLTSCLLIQNPEIEVRFTMEHRVLSDPRQHLKILTANLVSAGDSKGFYVCISNLSLVFLIAKLYDKIQTEYLSSATDIFECTPIKAKPRNEQQTNIKQNKDYLGALACTQKQGRVLMRSRILEKGAHLE